MVLGGNMICLKNQLKSSTQNRFMEFILSTDPSDFRLPFRNCGCEITLQQFIRRLTTEFNIKFKPAINFLCSCNFWNYNYELLEKAYFLYSILINHWEYFQRITNDCKIYLPLPQQLGRGEVRFSRRSLHVWRLCLFRGNCAEW